MDKGISVEVIWSDCDLVELRLRASNGRFAGATDCYAGHHVFARIADALRGFPSSIGDRRELVVGTIDPGQAGGGARLMLRCADPAGRVVTDLFLQAEPDWESGARQTASFSIPIEPAAIDEFVAKLSSLQPVVGAAARLRQAT